MIRDKNLYLKAFKEKNVHLATQVATLAPVWAQQFQEYKDLLKKVKDENASATSQIIEYKSFPTVYKYQQITSLLRDTQRDITRVTAWAQTIAKMEGTSEEKRVRGNICKAMQTDVSIQNQKHHANKNLLDGIDRSIDVSPRNSDNSKSYGYLQDQLPSHKVKKNLNLKIALEREEEFIDVTKNIHGVNDAVTRMGNLTTAQGEVIDRIDNNLVNAEDNMNRGNQHLRQRLNHQQGDSIDSPWSISSRVNKAIMFFYILNLVLIVVWFVKHL